MEKNSDNKKFLICDGVVTMNLRHPEKFDLKKTCAGVCYGNHPCFLPSLTGMPKCEGKDINLLFPARIADMMTTGLLYISRGDYTCEYDNHSPTFALLDFRFVRAFLDGVKAHKQLKDVAETWARSPGSDVQRVSAWIAYKSISNMYSPKNESLLHPRFSDADIANFNETHAMFTHFDAKGEWTVKAKLEFVSGLNNLARLKRRKLTPETTYPGFVDTFVNVFQLKHVSHATKLTLASELSSIAASATTQDELRKRTSDFLSKSLPRWSGLKCEFTQEGGIQDTDMSQYCHCDRGESCTEYDTHYSCQLSVSFNKMRVLHLVVDVEQEVDTGSDKVYFMKPEQKLLEMITNDAFWQNRGITSEQLTEDLETFLLKFSSFNALSSPIIEYENDEHEAYDEDDEHEVYDELQ